MNFGIIRASVMKKFYPSRDSHHHTAVLSNNKASGARIRDAPPVRSDARRLLGGGFFGAKECQ